MSTNQALSTVRVATGSHALERFALFKSLDREEISRIERSCRWRRFEPGSRILNHDDHSTEVYFVVNGLVRLWLPTFRRTDVILTDLGAGEFFGELAAIDGQHPRASATAITATTLACLHSVAFLNTVTEHTEVCTQLMRFLAARIRELDARVWELSTLSIRDRVRAELLRRGRTSPHQPNQAVVSPPPTHIELAARISGHREAVTRELRSLEREGLLQRRRGALVLCDVAALTDLLEKSRTVSPSRRTAD